MDNIPKLEIGGVCHASKVSIHFGEVEATYNAPPGKKFCLILIGDEDPKNPSLNADKFLTSAGWKFVND